MSISIPNRTVFYGPSRAMIWLMEGLALWRTAPIGVLMAAAAPILVEGLCQQIPGAGMLLSKLCATLISGWTLLMLDHRAKNGAFRPRLAWQQARRLWLPLLCAAVLGILVFVFQIGVGAVVAGPEQALLILSGRSGGLTITPTQLGVVLAAGVVPASLMMFVLPLVAIEGFKFGAAVRTGLGLFAQHWPAVSMLAAGYATLTVVAPRFPWVLIVLIPLGVCCGYSAYRDVYAAKVT